jgi:hypothetical protein
MGYTKMPMCERTGIRSYENNRVAEEASSVREYPARFHFRHAR